MTVPTLQPTLADVVITDAEAIEHALHQRRLADLGLLPDVAVVEGIAWSFAEAARLCSTVAALAAADYADDAPAYRRRYRCALWRSCQLHGAEYLYLSLTGLSRAALLAAPEVLLADTMGEGNDGA